MSAPAVEQIPVVHGEWLEADGLGGYAMGTSRGIATRGYHSLLTVAVTPPSGRVVLVNSVEVFASHKGISYPLCSFYYAPDTVHPLGVNYLSKFTPLPWPSWDFTLPGELEIHAELLMPKGSSLCLLSWSTNSKLKGVQLFVRPLLSGRSYHSLHRWNKDLSFDVRTAEGRQHFKPYAALPEIAALSNGEFKAEPLWYYNFVYTEERARGFGGIEDLASPGKFTFDLSRQEAILVLGTTPCIKELCTEKRGTAKQAAGNTMTAEALAQHLRQSEKKRRAALGSPTARAADQFIVRRGDGLTILAGYPWFTDWGRDTFISLRGLCIASGRLSDASKILSQWAKALSCSMMPNVFFDGASDPVYNAVDSSLWFVIGVYDLLSAYDNAGEKISLETKTALLAAVEAILIGYSQGTRYGIGADSDDLLFSGSPGVQLTWMDAKVGDYVVTPRSGKPVEIQALWLNALKIGSLLLKDSTGRWAGMFERGWASFNEKFWNEERNCLFDVVDIDRRPGACDARLRPNQILAMGGLPFAILDGAHGALMVETIEKTLVTPMGIRTLAPGERGYATRYEGNNEHRDFAYHMGTVWPWLLGPFIEAWVRVRGSNAKVKKEARQRFLAPMIERLDYASAGHVPEIADAEPPHYHRGCPMQAWSLGELIRVQRLLA